MDLELKILRNLDVREKKMRAGSAQRSRGQPLRTQTPESTSSQGPYRLFTDSSREFSAQGSLPVVLRGQTPNTISSENTYTASKHIIINSQDFMIKGSRNRKANNTGEAKLARGRNFFPERDSSDSSSSLSRTRKMKSLSPHSQDKKKKDNLASLVIQSRGISDLNHTREISPQTNSKEDSPRENHNQNQPSYKAPGAHLKALDQQGNMPLKAIMESNTERDSQRSIPVELEERLRFKSYKTGGSPTGLKAEVGGNVIKEMIGAPSKKKANRVPSSSSKSRSITNQSSIETGYGIAVQAKQISLNDSLNQTLLSLKTSTRPPTTEKKKAHKDAFGPSFTIKKKNRGDSLNDSSFI